MRCDVFEALAFFVRRDVGTSIETGKRMRLSHALVRMAAALASLLFAVAASASTADTTLIKESDDLIRDFCHDDNVSFTTYRKVNPWGPVTITKSRRGSDNDAPGGDRRPSGRWRDAGAGRRQRRYC